MPYKDPEKRREANLKAQKIYRKTARGKKMRSAQASRRYQKLKNNPTYREKQNKNKLIWTKKSGPAQDHRKEQAAEYSKGYRNDPSKKSIIHKTEKTWYKTDSGQYASSDLSITWKDARLPLKVY
jgi:hypothetical protein